MTQVRENQTIRGPLSGLMDDEHKDRYFVRRLHKRKKNGDVTAILEGHLDGPGDTILRAEVTVTFAGGEVTEPWEVVGDAAA